ncbi:MAG: hypothetical protein LAP61_21060, partial [Acidobacteriia bacterium]|nr:hypothetical protein [Terriglobia bacterium]
MRLLFFLPALAVVGQSLVLTPGVTGIVVDPGMAGDQSWRVEFQLSSWTLPPAGGWWNAPVFDLQGTGAAAYIWP